jgi:hypothetical protein
VALHVLKDLGSEGEAPNVVRMGAVWRGLRGVPQVMHLLGQCGDTFVSELLPYSLEEVLQSAAPKEGGQGGGGGFERCAPVCGRLELAGDETRWCGARAVMPQDETARAAAALGPSSPVIGSHRCVLSCDWLTPMRPLL